jgi:hypothetical protein
LNKQTDPFSGETCREELLYTFSLVRQYPYQGPAAATKWADAASADKYGYSEMRDGAVSLGRVDIPGGLGEGTVIRAEVPPRRLCRLLCRRHRRM